MRVYKDEYLKSRNQINLKNMQKLREEKKYTQVKLQHLVGITQQSITFYENGVRVPSLPIAYKIADVLGCSIDFLVGRDETLEKYYRLSEEDRKIINDMIDSLLKKE